MKRSADEILNDAMPIKSTKRYEDTWKDFCKYIDTGQQNWEPSEEEYLQYFDYLKTVKKIRKQHNVVSIFYAEPYVSAKIWQKVTDVPSYNTSS